MSVIEATAAPAIRTGARRAGRGAKDAVVDAAHLPEERAFVILSVANGQGQGLQVVEKLRRGQRLRGEPIEVRRSTVAEL